jgi:hypothetical protein
MFMRDYLLVLPNQTLQEWLQRCLALDCRCFSSPWLSVALSQTVEMPLHAANNMNVVVTIVQRRSK